MPGVGIRGGLRIFDWDAFAVLDISTQGIPGFLGHLEAEKIEIGRVLKIWGDGQGIHKTPKTAEDFNQQVKSKVGALAAGQPTPATPAVAKDAGDWFLEPGGPVLHLSTRSAPFLHADLHAQLFGFLQTDIHADITDEGFDFDFKIGAGNEVTTELECHWWHKEGKLEAHGDMGIHLHGDIGPIIPHVAATQFHLDTDLDAHVSLIVDREQFNFTVNGSFAYQGASVHLPELVITVQLSTLADLAKAVWDHIVAMAEHIFAEFLLPVGKFIAEGAKEVAQVAEAAAHEVAQVAVAAATEVKQITGDVADTMAKAADEIGQAAEQLAGEAETLASHAAQAALDAAAPLLDKASDLSNKARQFAADAAASVKAIAEDVAALVDEAAHYAIHVAEQAAQWVAEKWDEARRWVAARLEQAAALVSQLAQEADEAVRAIEDEIAELGRQLEDLLSRAAQSVEDTLSSGWNTATSWIPSPF
jgi:ABC-type transporter Mla subunit MlaD